MERRRNDSVLLCLNAQVHLRKVFHSTNIKTYALIFLYDLEYILVIQTFMWKKNISLVLEEVLFRGPEFMFECNYQFSISKDKRRYYYNNDC